ncbi:type II toxin-antitoxin system HicA family toxin [Myxosarcina sp. GI1]|uniref:type II toxin-antitoxin system HicA family toxin n=1 Tax=Myxosarcina sp. GI1 TaxID=1541065 RepID=UPI0005604C65|nr:type II toxin-antitoxin system HicA family toxin [Myxosarcina sp. GI1]
MSKYKKLLQKILTGTSDNNINFSELRQLLKKLGFEERVKGGHYIFTKVNVEEIINLQPKSGKAKSYQVKQIRNLVVKYRLGDSNVD